MLKLLVLTCLVGLAFASRSAHRGIRGRIINGTAAEEGEFPFAIALRHATFYNIELCGGSILNKNYVLTAGHCVDCEGGETSDDPSEFNIQYGLVNITQDDTNSVANKANLLQQFNKNLRQWILRKLIRHRGFRIGNTLPDDGSWEPVTLSRVFDSSVQQEGVIMGNYRRNGL